MTRQIPLTVYKSILKPTPLQTIGVPDGAEFLCAREQHEKICVWYRCNPTMPMVQATFSIVGTGHPAGELDQWRYLGTASLENGYSMAHVFILKLPLPEPWVPPDDDTPPQD